MTTILKISTLSFILCLSIGKGHAQYFEIGVKGGAVMYDGDLNTNLIFTNITNTRLAYAGFVKLNFRKYFGVQVNYMQGRLYGDDSKSLLGWQITRNLHFFSDISEVSLLFEFHLPKIKHRIRKFNPYLFIGYGIFAFTPKTVYQGEVIELQPLGTEGQGLAGFPAKYNLFSYSIPFGIGFKFPLSKHVFLGLELSTRWTLTDYIDDISQDYLAYDFLKTNNGQLAADLANRSGELEGRTRKDLTGINRGNNSNDSFYTAMLTLSYRFTEPPKGRKLFRRKGVSCPSF